MKAYMKKELRFLRQQKPELARRVTAPRTVAKGYIFTQPRPIATMGRGILLSGVRRQKQYHSQSDKRDHDQTSHGRAPFPACAAPSAGSRVKRSNRAVRVIAYPLSPRNTKRIAATGYQAVHSAGHIGPFRPPGQSLSLSFPCPLRSPSVSRATLPRLLVNFCKN